MFVIGANSASTGYNLTRSLRFRASATAYLGRTPATTTNQQTWTFSAWFKRGTLTVDTTTLLSAAIDANNFTVISFADSGTGYLSFTYVTGGNDTYRIVTNQVFRDPSAWYHIVAVADTTNATGSNRLKLYINGVQITSFSYATYPPQNTNLYVNSTVAQGIGITRAVGRYYDGYMTEINFIDGQALTPSSFGSTNSTTGVWQPARYTGTYGTNGFYLPFTDNSALTTASNVGLGKDFSGNANYWVTNNISITAGVTYDSMTDVPTLTSATAANFCTLNPLANGAAVPSGGNLNQGASGANERCNSTIFVSSGKWYFEVTLNTAGTNTSVGIGQNNITNQYPGNDILSFVQEIDNARKGNNNTYTAYGTALTANQVFMCAIDLTNLKLFFGSQGTWFASSDPVTGASPAFTLTAGLYCAISRPYGGSAAISINFGQRPFTYTAPTGYVALNTYNLPTSTIVKGNTVMDATLYTGNGSTQTITNAAAFKPDLVWAKSRSSASWWHILVDSVRGVGRTLSSNVTNAEIGSGTDLIPAINSNGFNVNVSPNATVNENATTYVAWQWQAGQGSTSSNTSGSITSTVSVNASAGFSIVSYTGTGANATVGHGLGVAPQFIITKNRSAASAWHCYVAAISGMQNGYIVLNSTAAFSTSTNTVWNGTQPTSSVFSVGTDSGVNGSGNAEIAYCWTPIAGFSAFGSYTGNGSTNGPFVYTGFRPKFVLIKWSSGVENWAIIDTSRATYNAVINQLFANTSGAENTDANQAVDILSNGFKLRGSLDLFNNSGGTYIYMAYAENPFRNALAR